MDFNEIYPDSSSSVALAARSGNLASLKNLISEKKPFERQDNRGWRPIHEAAYWNHSHCLEYLLNLDIHVNSTTFEGQTALWLAASNNCIASVKTLLKAKAMVNIPNNEDVTPLHIACSKGFLEVIQMFIENGVNVNLKDYGLFTALHEAAIPGHSAVVEILLRNGADKTVQDSLGRTPLFCAAQSHSCQVVSIFLSNASSTYINMRAGDGATAVMLASQSGCLNCVKMMVEHGADPNLKAYDGVMAVHLALTRNHTNVLRFLLTITDHSYVEQSCLTSIHHHHRVEANWNQAGMESVNIFTLAVTYDRFELIETLVEEGLIPDRYPSQWRFSGALEILQRNKSHNWKWSTPLGFIVSHSPFCQKSAKAAQLLIQTGSDVNAKHKDFIPPIVALITAVGWENDREFPILSDTLKFLVQTGRIHRFRTCDSIELMNDALAFNPRALISLIQTGFIVDASAIKCSIETNRHVSGPLNLIHMKYISILHASGFLMEFDVLPQRSSTSKYGSKIYTLKELSRHKIHSLLSNSKVDFLIPEWNISLPQKLFSYLCYDDIQI